MKRKGNLGVALLMVLSSTAFAANSSNNSLFIGLGGSYNSVNLNQNTDISAVSNVYLGHNRLATGSSGGAANPFDNTQNAFAPVAQLGYFHNTADNKWLVGGKFIYQYMGSINFDNNVSGFQTRSYTTILGGDFYTGRMRDASAQVKVNNQVALLAFIGHSFMQKGFVYFGIGPTLLDSKTALNNVSSYVDINGNQGDVTGTPLNFSSSKWMWGGAAQIGATYYLDPTWFVDLNYTYALTAHYVTNYSSTFSTTTVISSRYENIGTVNARVNQQITSQAIMLTINKRFSF